MTVAVTRVVATAAEAVALIKVLKTIGATDVEARALGPWLSRDGDAVFPGSVGCRAEREKL